MKLEELQADVPVESLAWIREFLVKPDGEIEKVVVDFTAFRALLDELEDAALERAMKEVMDETPLDRGAALRELECD